MTTITPYPGLRVWHVATGKGCIGIVLVQVTPSTTFVQWDGVITYTEGDWALVLWIRWSNYSNLTLGHRLKWLITYNGRKPLGIPHE